MPKSNMLHSAKQLYRYRWLVYELVLRNVRLRYRGSVLGLVWTLLNPLIFMALYTIVFSVFMKNRVPNYPLYLLAGIIPFNFFANSLIQGTTSIIDGRFYVGKTLFPSVVLLVVPVLTNAVNFFLSMPLVLILMVALKVHLGWGLLFLPVVFVIQILLTQAIVSVLATVNVFYRDVQELMNYATSVLFFLTPIFYLASVVPERWSGIIRFNPLAAIIDSYHRILYDGALPSFSQLGFALVVGVVGLLVANTVFERYRESFSQYL